MKKWLVILAVISILKCLLLYWVFEVKATPERRIGYLPDSRMYETLAKNIISGNGFSSDTEAPFVPMMLKEPGYPLFIVLVSIISVFSSGAIIAAQMMLNPMVAILIYLIGKQLYDEDKARLASLMVAFMPNYGEMSFFILAETLYIPLLLLFVYTMVLAFNKDKILCYAICGFVLALSVLTRAFVLYFFFCVIAMIAFGYGKGLQFHKKEKFKIRLRKISVFALSFLLIVLPWVIRNGKTFGIYQITTKGGITLWAKGSIAENLSARDIKAYSLYLLSGRLAQKKFPGLINDLGSFEYRFMPMQELLSKDLNAGRRDAALGKEGLKKIFSHPFKAFLFSAIIYAQVYKCFVPWSILFYEFGSNFLREIILPAARFLFGFPMGITLALIVIFGIYFSKQEAHKYLPVVFLFIYYHLLLFVIAATPGGLQRFILPVTPLYFIFLPLFFAGFRKQPSP